MKSFVRVTPVDPQEIARRQRAEEVDNYIRPRHAVPNNMCDIFTFDLIKHPVKIDADPTKHTFDLAGLRAWDATGGTHPLSRDVIAGRRLTVDHDMRHDLASFHREVSTRYLQLGSLSRSLREEGLFDDGDWHTIESNLHPLRGRVVTLEAAQAILQVAFVGWTNLLKQLNPMLQTCTNANLVGAADARIAQGALTVDRLQAFWPREPLSDADAPFLAAAARQLFQITLALVPYRNRLNT